MRSLFCLVTNQSMALIIQRLPLISNLSSYTKKHSLLTNENASSVSSGTAAHPFLYQNAMDLFPSKPAGGNPMRVPFPFSAQFYPK